MPTFLVTVYHYRKPAVLNPGEPVVKAGLHRLGLVEIEKVHMGHYLDLTIQARHGEEAEAVADTACKRLLVNHVTDLYRVDKAKEVPETQKQVP